METEPLYQILNINLYKNDSSIITDVKTVETSSGSSIGLYSSINPEAFASGSIVGDIEYAGGSISSANFITGSQGWKLSSDGSIEASDGTFRGTITASSGTIAGWIIGADTLSSAASGERLVLDKGNTNLDLINSSGTTVVSMDYGATTGDPLININVADDSRTGLKITTGNVGSSSLWIDNNSSDVSSSGLIIDRAGNSASDLIGLQVLGSNAGAGGNLGIRLDSTLSTGIQVTGITNAFRATVAAGSITTLAGRIQILDASGNTRYIAVYSS